MNDVYQFVSSLGIGAGSVILVVFCFFISFVILYCVPYWQMSRRLRTITRAIKQRDKEFKQLNPEACLPIEEVTNLMTMQPFDHIWSEYTESLHTMKENIDGEERIIRIRSTVPAETFFTQQALIDTPLRTEFFKHLPGILTGTGIIGTFWGLLQGLQHFNTNDEAAKIRESLELLFHGVREAFIASFVAIAAAMLVTLLEKLCYRHQCKLVEDLTRSIDALYQAGVGEEYLQELVKSSKQSATHAGQLKDNLVGDLKIIMTNLGDRLAALNERQILVQGEQSEAAAQRISQAVSDNIKEPLSKMSQAWVERETHQGQVATGQMERYFAEFMGNFESSFGSKFTDLTVAMASVAQSTKDTQERFSGILEGMQRTGTQTSEVMAEKFNEMISTAATQLQHITQGMADMANNLGGDLGKAQESSSAALTSLMTAAEERQLKLQAMLEHFLQQTRDEQTRHGKVQTEQLEASVQKLQESLTSVGQHLATLQKTSLEQTRQAFGEISSETEKLATTASATTARMEQTLASLSANATVMIDKMANGAEVLYLAATDFGKAGDTVGTVLTKGSEIFATLTKASSTLEQTQRAAQSLLADHAQQRQTIATLIATLEQLVRTAKTEAGINTQRIDEMRKISDRMGEVQVKAEGYLKGVNQVFQEAFQKFNKATNDSIVTNANHFTESLQRAVGTIREQLDDLEGILGSFVDRQGGRS